jgi:hypothetical protein
MLSPYSKLSLGKTINTPVQIGTQVSSGCQRQVSWNTHAVPQIDKAIQYSHCLGFWHSIAQHFHVCIWRVTFVQECQTHDSQSLIHNGPNIAVGLSIRISQFGAKGFSWIFASIRTSTSCKSGNLKNEKRKVSMDKTERETSISE